MKEYISKFSTAYNLGFKNIFHVIVYRVLLFFSIHPVCLIKGNFLRGVFFEKPKLTNTNNSLDIPIDGFKYFGHKKISINSSLPNWFLDPFSNQSFENNMPWWKISDFDNEIGDIKIIWEASRMNWLIPFVQKIKTGNFEHLHQLNHLMNDWCIHNQPYKGFNWKCGQEASIRVLNCICALLILDAEDKPSNALKNFIEVHLDRIYPTIQYAKAQNNNHGISEAAALYVGSSLISDNYKIKKYQDLGRKLLEDRVKILIEDDGTFSQYSSNYHRMAQDILSIVEIWRRRKNLKPFTNNFYSKAKKLAFWLHNLVNKDSGDVPNIGANDGAHLFNISNCSYRDFRPSVELAVNLFCNASAFQNRASNEHLSWLGIQKSKKTIDQPLFKQFLNGGFTTVRNKNNFLLFRHPNFKFRPSQADALHVDFWINNNNLLSDAGTYSYNISDEITDLYSGVKGHNTIEFDNRDQMPRYSRFLYGKWIKTVELKKIKNDGTNLHFSATSKDYKNVLHTRDIKLSNDRLSINDRILGFQKIAKLRWRLDSGLWKIKNNHNDLLVQAGNVKIIIKSDNKFEYNLVDSFNSKYYLNKEKIKVLEIEISKPGQILTDISW